VEGNKTTSLESDFLGTYSVLLDDKNRFCFPAEFRSNLKNKDLIITKGMDGCLYVFSEERFKIFCEKHFPSTQGIEKRILRKLKRTFTASAIKKKIDSQGRILLSQQLIEMGDLKKELTIVGVGERIEIWNKEKWQKEFESLDGIEDYLEEL
jgi:MraZ protein